MTAKDILLYQFGQRAAIERAARNKWLPLISAILVLITSVPRNYDQTYLGEVPWSPVLPLVFSFFSGLFVYAILWRAFIRDSLKSENEGRDYTGQFLGLFWMTAPVAWLYAIPVERMLDARGAAVANLYLLGVVSIWRVALLSRVLAVLFKVAPLRATACVLLAACIEVVAVLFFRNFGLAVGRGMAGMRNSPEEDLFISVLTVVFFAALALIPFLLIVVILDRLGAAQRVPPKTEQSPIPWPALVCSVVVWSVVAIEPQSKLRHEFAYAAYLKRDQFKEALAYLNRLEPSDWPAAKPFRPNPYENEVWWHLPDLFDATTGREKEWVRARMLDIYLATFNHRSSRFTHEEHLIILEGIERFPGGADWILLHREKLGKAPELSRWRGGENQEGAKLELEQFLKNHGIALDPN